MTSLCIDELSNEFKQLWGWPASATHVPACAGSPLLSPIPLWWVAIDGADLDHWQRVAFAPHTEATPSAVCAPVAGIHGKAAPSMG